MTGAIRKRIALVYGAVFLVLGGCLLTVVYLLSSAGTETEAAEIAARVVPAYPPSSGNGYYLTDEGHLAPVTVYQLTDNVSDAASDELMFWSVGALVVTALCAVGVGWWTAGRVLRPVHAMTAKARLLSEHNLHERIGSTGPNDELKELGDTLDELLGRLQTAFDSQRRFIANASHELRTPLATQRTAIQVGLAGANSPEELARTKQMLLDNNRRSERLIEGLLVLARSERQVEDQEEIRWGELVTEEAARHGLTVTVSVSEPGGVRGNRALLDRVVSNLLANAQAYGKGEVDVSVSGTAMTVRNNGPHISPEETAALFEPFRRGEGRDRMGPGAGLGLSIVRSIVTAHGGRVTAEPGGDGGGLSVRVELPASAGSAGR
ncbi:HAMP domain-containing sensor histidine kinase [Streptomyces niveus]|uniref:histidine kinase n=1 Tax=Streptomyces niveus TaxID=193462 RepID=A0A1U9QU94_STRNV|nr:HAMP domain-containing sensor histidine kinase [Streptomyces niveus]AQU67563.1 two-component sensor histidine kinase [Streptomyces niveus]